MPSGILPDVGIADQLSYILSATISGVVNWQLLLFVNDYTPTSSTILSDLVEASWPGYSRVTLDRGTWNTPTVSAGCATATYGSAPLVYYVGGVGSGVINYGAAYYDPGSNVLRWVQRFDTADLVPLQAGGQFQLPVQYTLTSAACPGAMALARRKRKTTRRKIRG